MRRLLLALALLWPVVGWGANFTAGFAAYKRGDFKTALQELKPFAKQGDAIAQFMVGDIYADGQGVGQDYAEAVKWYRLAAMQDFRSAQYSLGAMYADGQGVAQDDAEAAKWYRLAAMQGFSPAQYALAFMYYHGKGVPQDDVRAYAWSNLAAAQGIKNAAKNRDLGRRRMTKYQVAEGQRLSRKFAAQIAAHNGKPREAVGTQKHTPPALSARPVASGSGFVVSAAGDLLTNFHVVKDCLKVTVSPSGNGKATRVTITVTDKINDLAALKLPGPLGQPESGLLAMFQSNKNIARFRASRRARLGESIMVAGFPLKGLLSQGLNVTTGTVTALAGIGDDARMLQISAPVQAGNSGGPLLDASGNVIGIVVSKLNAVKVRRLTGDLAQNVNFAIKGAVVRSFLDIHGIEYQTARSSGKLDTAAIAEKARGFTVAVECWK